MESITFELSCSEDNTFAKVFGSPCITLETPDKPVHGKRCVVHTGAESLARVGALGVICEAIQRVQDLQAGALPPQIDLT